MQKKVIETKIEMLEYIFESLMYPPLKLFPTRLEREIENPIGIM